MSGPSINMSKTEPVKCPKCGKQAFTQSMLLRRIDPLLTGTGQPGLVPVMVFECTNCHAILEEYLPEELKGIYKED